jgi:hypothetical protein
MEGLGKCSPTESHLGAKALLVQVLIQPMSLKPVLLLLLPAALHPPQSC